MDELAAGLGDFSDHREFVVIDLLLYRERACRAAARGRLGTSPWGRASWFSSGANFPRATAAGFFDDEL
jgi:hypothetical protein